MTTTVLLAVAGVIIGLVVSYVWYAHKPKTAARYAGQAALLFLVSFSTVYIVTESIQNGLSATMAIAFPLFNWLCFIVPAVGMGVLSGNLERSAAWKKFLLDSAYFLAVILLIGFMTSFFA